MVIENLEVKHKAFGAGVVVGNRGKYFTVRFANTEKTFVYPDIFEKFLTLADGTVSDEIIADLESVKKEKQLIQDKRNEENLRAMTRGIVISGKDLSSELEEDENHRQVSEIEDI